MYQKIIHLAAWLIYLFFAKLPVLFSVYFHVFTNVVNLFLSSGILSTPSNLNVVFLSASTLQWLLMF